MGGELVCGCMHRMRMRELTVPIPMVDERWAMADGRWTILVRLGRTLRRYLETPLLARLSLHIYLTLVISLIFFADG